MRVVKRRSTSGFEDGVTLFEVPYCRCRRGQQDGWSNLDQPPDVWVHPTCGLPSRANALRQAQSR